jgi:hypothetical protein
MGLKMTQSDAGNSHRLASLAKRTGRSPQMRDPLAGRTLMSWAVGGHCLIAVNWVGATSAGAGASVGRAVGSFARVAGAGVCVGVGQCK